MSFSELTGPVIHIGVPAVLAMTLRLNPLVAIVCGILPDMVDKPLSAMGIGGGRFIGHTLLFAGVIIILFTVWKRKYGLAALIGLASHLLLDLDGLVPWFYPFKNYQFYNFEINIFDYVKSYFTFSRIGLELIVVALAGIVIFTGWRLYRWYTTRKKS
jgi:hypothetical protein